VRDIERGQAMVSGRLVLSDGPDHWQVVANMDGGASVVLAGGGDDRIVGHDAAEDVDGGPGADHLEGGRGHDVLRGGPGRDTIFGDETNSTCRPAYPESCVRYGNDVIDARDGEVDQVDCGPGLDRAAVDAVDVVAATCEVVEHGGTTPGPGPAAQAPGRPPGAGAAGPTAGGRGSLVVAGRPTLRGVVRTGLLVRLTGVRPGPAAFEARLGRTAWRPGWSGCRPRAGPRCACASPRPAGARSPAGSGPPSSSRAPGCGAA
jgi:Ca2+-binding RTX toxin-like protein